MLTPIGIAVVGTLLGTWLGFRWLRKFPESLFRRLVAGLLLMLGSFMLLKGLR